MKPRYKSLMIQAQAELEKRRRHSWRETLRGHGYDPDVVKNDLVQMVVRLLNVSDQSTFEEKAEAEKQRFLTQPENWKHEDGRIVLQRDGNRL